MQSLGGKTTFKKYGSEHFKEMAKKSFAKRTANMTKEEKSEYFKKIRAGISPTTQEESVIERSS